MTQKVCFLHFHNTTRRSLTFHGTLAYCFPVLLSHQPNRYCTINQKVLFWTVPLLCVNFKAKAAWETGASQASSSSVKRRAVSSVQEVQARLEAAQREQRRLTQHSAEVLAENAQLKEDLSRAVMRLGALHSDMHNHSTQVVRNRVRLFKFFCIARS